MPPGTLLNKVLRSIQLKYCFLISAVSTHSIKTCLIVRGFKEWNGRQGAKVKHVNVRVALATQLIGSLRSGLGQWTSVCSLPGLVSDSNQHKLVMWERRWGEVNWLFNVTINNISGIYVTAHRCTGGLKKLDLRSSSQRHSPREGPGCLSRECVLGIPSLIVKGD